MVVLDPPATVSPRTRRGGSVQRALPETNRWRPARPAAGRRTHTSVASSRPSCPLVPRVGDDVGSGVQPDSAGDGAAALGQRRADLADRPGDRGAGDPEPAGQHVMGDSVAGVHQGGQQPVDEYQPLPGTRPYRPLARPIGQSRLLARLPAWPQLARPAQPPPPGTAQSPGDRRQRRLRPESSTHSDPAPSFTSTPSR